MFVQLVIFPTSICRNFATKINMDKCNNILKDAQEIRVSLFNKGQDVDETVICELLTSYDSNCHMDKTEYIFNMITNNDTALVNLDSNLEKSSNPEDSIKQFFNEIESAMEIESMMHDNLDNPDITDVTDVTDKVIESNTPNSSGIYVTAEIIDISSDSNNATNFCQPANDNDVIIENAIHPLPSFASLSEPCADTSSLHQPMITCNDNQVKCSKEDNNDVIYIKKVIHKKIRSESPQPGCSKDFDLANIFPELEETSDCNNCNDCYDCYASYASNKRLREEAEKIHSLLPSYSYNSIFEKLVTNNFAKNRIELALWDLLPVERPKIQYKQLNSSSYNRCMQFENCHNFSDKSLTDTETISKKEEKACANNRVIADIKSENEKSKWPINNNTKSNIMEDIMVEDVFSNNINQQIVTPVQTQETKLNELKMSNEEEGMPLLKKIKLDQLDASNEDTNNCNNDNQQKTSFGKEKLSEHDTSSKDINKCNMHDSEKSVLPEIDLIDTMLKSTKDTMLENYKKDCDIRNYNNSIPRPTLIRPGRFSFNANNMDAVAGPSTSSSSPPSSSSSSSLFPFQSSILLPAKFRYLEKKQELTQYSPNANCLGTQNFISKAFTNPRYEYNPFRTLTKDKKESEIEKHLKAALPHSSVKLRNAAIFSNRLSDRKTECEFQKRVIPNLNMFPNPTCAFNLYNPQSFSPNNTLHPIQLNGTKDMPVLNLSQKNNSEESNLEQKGDEVNTEVYNQENMEQKNPHTSASEGQVNRNNVEEIVLNEKALKLYYKLIPMFPSVNTKFVKQLCQNSVANMQTTDEAMLLQHLVDQLLDHGPEHPYIKKQEPLELVQSAITYDLNEQYADLLGIFPEADPEYLRQVAEKIYNNPEEFKLFVQSKLENPDYPTRQQYLNKKKISEQVKQYTTNFNVQQFLDIFPNPFAHFEDRQRQCVFNAYAVDFLKYYFSKIRVNTMLGFYSRNGYNLSATVKALETLTPNMKTKRSSKIMPTENIPLLQEIAFIQHKVEIQDYLDKLKAEEMQEFNKLKITNGLLECQCCYDNECMPSKCSTCEDGHIFCNLCIARSTDVTLADGKTHVLCLINCGREFSLSILQRILPPTKFSILLCKRQEAEVMAAGVEGLVSCPFCHFASIPPPEDKVFKCLNPDCMKESCRLCKELNHVPLKCDEIKTDAARLYLEEKMTEALVRKCYNCGRTFFKEDGCNKMTCICGALMCYICDKPVKGYDHFRGQGAMASNLCPLWSDDRRMNAESVIKVCQETMKHIKEKNPNININVESLLPKLPPKAKGPHEDIANVNAVPIHADRIARQNQ